MPHVGFSSLTRSSSLCWEHGILATGPPGNSLLLVLYGFIFPPTEIHPLVVLTARLCRWEALRLDVKMPLFCFLVLAGWHVPRVSPCCFGKAAAVRLRAQEKASLSPFLGREPVYSFSEQCGPERSCLYLSCFILGVAYLTIYS